MLIFPLSVVCQEDSNPPEIVSSSDTIKKSTFLMDFLKSALIDKYESTAAFASKLVWPLVALLLSLLFYADVSNVVEKIAENLSKTKRIVVAGIELEVYEDSLSISDIQAYEVIQEIGRDELLVLLAMEDISVEISSQDLEGKQETLYKSLEERQLVSIDYDATSIIDSAPVITIKPTELGNRVIKETQNILLNFINNLPAND